MKAFDVRQSFLDFFLRYGHKIVSSAPVVPGDDPTLLFTNAGMNQFKDIFLGTGSRPYTRAADSQKCIRVSGKHNDLEEVGFDTYHHTFFEMLGNWSFGDYYKKEAIAWAWELVAGVWKFPKKQLWATVFREDDEAESLWKSATDIDPSHVLRFGEKDNFWEMGETGPCGPCSEIHIDRGEGYCDKAHVPGHQCGVNGGCARIIELWNLVFIQYNRMEGGKVETLPAKHVDTGMGLERVVAVLQGKVSNYETDLFLPLIDRLEELSGRPADSPDLLPAFRVVADHIRALTFAITDNAIPSNEGRGDVLRRILRRAARYGRKLGLHEPFMHLLVPVVVDVMGEAYPEIRERVQHTALVIKSEEERFNEVLDRGLEIFEKMADQAAAGGRKFLSGTDVFRLYDTYGFPLDLTRLMAHEKNLEIEEEGFLRELESQRRRAREAGKFQSEGEENWQVHSSGKDSQFVGYETLAADSRIRKTRSEDERIWLILDRTPFYAESGGQKGDIGEIVGPSFRIRIEDTQKSGDRIIHVGQFLEGRSIDAIDVKARVDRENRLSTARNHTATHLLHRALKEVLGTHVNQAGSLVTPSRLRFDFTHFEPVHADRWDEIEKRVNSHIRENLRVVKSFTSLRKAREEGATALFGEKYGDEVRVVAIDDYSKELCGGTHCDATGEIGYFRILHEEGVAAGVRRIEAVTGAESDRVVREERLVFERLGDALKCPPAEVENRVEGLLSLCWDLEKKSKASRKEAAMSDVDSLVEHSLDVAGIRCAAGVLEAASAEELRGLGDQLRKKLKSGVGVVAAVLGDRVGFLAVVTDDLIRDRRLKAGDVVKRVAGSIGGSGGGKDHMAMAGAKDVHRIPEAMALVPDILKELSGS